MKKIKKVLIKGGSTFKFQVKVLKIYGARSFKKKKNFP